MKNVKRAVRELLGIPQWPEEREMRLIKEIMFRVGRATRELFGMSTLPNNQKIQLENFSPQTFEEQIYCSVVFKNDICYDIGANVGNVSLLLARLAGKDGFVLAFEPVWPTYTILCDRVRGAADMSSPIVTVPFGLADEEMVATIQIPGGDFGMGSIASANDWSEAHFGAKISSYECRFSRLDSIRLSLKLAVADFIKIDVEGAELFVLQGANEIFNDGHRPLMLIELFAPWERAFNYGPWKVLSMLTNLGYSYYYACPEGLIEYRPSEKHPFPSEYVHGYNLLAFCKEKHSERIKNLASLVVGGGGNILPMSPPPVLNVLE